VSMLPTPNFVLMSEYRPYMGSSSDPVVLPAGAFVRPIDLKYVPKHVIEDRRWSSFNEKTEVFCYTRVGIIPIPIDAMRPA
jgi:hypothetical protein